VVQVNPNPVAVIQSVDSTVCVGDSLELDAGTGYFGYHWSTGETTQKIFVPAGSYSLWVSDSSGCRSRLAKVRVDLKRISARPEVTRDVNTLTATPAVRYQWFKDSVLLPGETGQSLALTTTGKYTVMAYDADDACGTMSDVVDVLVLDVEETPGASSFTLYPDPHDGVFIVEGAATGASEVVIRVTDILGKTQSTHRARSIDGRFRQVIDISAAPAGLYFVRVQTGSQMMVRKVLKK
jgi:hypothetical protein